MAPALTVPKVSAAETGRGPATWHPTQGAAHGKRAGGRRPCWRQTLHNTHAWQASRTAPRPSSRGRDAARPGAQGSLPRLRLAVRRPGGSGSRCPSPAALGHLGSRSTGPWALLLWPAGRDPWPSPHSRGTAAAPRLTCIFMPSRPSLGRKRARSGSEGRAGARRCPQPCPVTAAGSLHRDAGRLAAQGRREAPSRTRSPPAPGHRSRPPRCPHPQGLPDGPRSGPAFRSAQSLHRVVASSTETALPSLTRHRALCQHTARRHTHVCTGLEATPTRALTRGNREFWRRAPGTRWRPARPRASARAC